MKKTGILLTALVLTVFVLTGCGCRNSKPAATTVPTTQATTAPTTQATTAPTTMSTEPSVDATIPDGNGPISTDGTEGETGNVNSRSGGMVGGGITGGTGSGNGITGSIG